MSPAYTNQYDPSGSPVVVVVVLVAVGCFLVGAFVGPQLGSWISRTGTGEQSAGRATTAFSELCFADVCGTMSALIYPDVTKESVCEKLGGRWYVNNSWGQDFPRCEVTQYATCAQAGGKLGYYITDEQPYCVKQSFNPPDGLWVDL